MFGLLADAFGVIFRQQIECRKVAGPYMFVILVSLAWVIAIVSTVVGVLYFIGYAIYRNTYLVDALSDRIPRAFGGGIVISRTLDNSSDNTVNK